MRKARCRWLDEGGKRDPQWAEAAAIVVSSIRGDKLLSKDGISVGIPVTSRCRTSSLCLSTARPSRIWSLTFERSLRAVAMTGQSVVLSRRLAKCRPIPREAGEINAHGLDIVLVMGRLGVWVQMCVEAAYYGVRLHDRSWTPKTGTVLLELWE